MTFLSFLSGHFLFLLCLTIKNAYKTFNFEDSNIIVDNSDQVELLDTVEAYVDDYDDQDSDPEYKPATNKAIKIELEAIMHLDLLRMDKYCLDLK